MDDSKIIELFFERSEQAIAALSEKYGNTCKRIAYNILGNDLDAQECVNDAYWGLWNKIPPETPKPLSVYVYRVVRNLAIKKYCANTAAKRNSYYDATLDELENCLPSSFDIENEISTITLSEEIDRFLDSLDKEKRVIFVKRYWFGASIKEIAEETNLNSHNISVKLSRTRKALKKHLAEKGFNV